MAKKKVTYGVILTAAFGVILYSTKAVFVKLAYRYGIDVVPLLVLRMGISMPFYWLIGFLDFRKNSTQYQPTLSENGYIVFLGFIGYYLSSWFDFEGLKYIGAGLERLILFIYPTIIVFLSRWYLKTPITKNQILSIVITYVGMVVVFWRGLTTSSGNETMLIGGMLILACAFTYAIYLVGSNKILLKLGSVNFTARVMTASFVVVLIHYVVQYGFVWQTYPTELYWICFLMAVFSTIIPSFLIADAIKKMDANVVGVIGSLGPVSTITMSIFFLGELLYPEQFVGGLIIVCGVVYMGIMKGREAI